MSEAAQPEARQRLGDFEISGEIGRGGMGVVYEARQLSLNRKVALKVLSSGLGLSSQAVVRFRREAEAAAKLHHTNIVPIYATGEQDGTYYYAMELVEGPSLNQVIQQMRALPAGERTGTTTLSACVERAATGQAAGTPSSPPPADGSTTLDSGSGYFDTVARMTAEVADALDYAHDQGVIHRDVKPSNLLLSPAGRLSINDFGLARMLEQPGMTMTGEFVGSPLYMSPEQITAGRAPLDHRTDIYSLGATLYELLTLAPPFPGERRDQIIAQIIHKEPRPPRRVNRKVPVDLETICLKSMEKDPDRRYQTAGQMAEDLRRFVNRFAISARRAGPVARTVKWMRRRPAVAGLVLCVVLALAAAALFAYNAHQSKQQMVAVQRQKAMDDALLAAMSGDFEAAGAAIQQAELLGASPGWIRMLHGQVALHQGRARQAVEHLEQAVRLLPDSVAAQSLLAVACNEAGYSVRYYQMLEDLDRLTPVTAEDCLFKGLAEGWAQTYTGLRRGLGMMDEAIRRRDSTVARVIRARARTWRAMDTGSLNDVEAALEDAAIARGMLPDSLVALREHLLAHLVAANVFENAGQQARREASLAEAGQDAQSLERFPGLSLAHEARARYFEHVGQKDAALAELRRASEAPHASSGVARQYAAALYARAAFDEALRVLDRFGEQSDSTNIDSYRLFVMTELPDGQARALAACDQAAERDVRGIFAFDPSLVLRLLGRKSEAVDYCRQARDRFTRGLPPWMLEWYQHFGDYHCGIISADEFLKAAGESRWNQCEAHFIIGLDLLADADRAGAAEQFQKCVDTYAREYFEYTWSRAFLAGLKRDPTWPPWIPMRDATNEGVRSAAGP